MAETSTAAMPRLATNVSRAVRRCVKKIAKTAVMIELNPSKDADFESRMVRQA